MNWYAFWGGNTNQYYVDSRAFSFGQETLNGGLCVMATDASVCVSCQARRGSDTEQFLACQDKTCIVLKHTTEQDENVLVFLETAPSSPHFYYLSNFWVLYPSETPNQFTGLPSSHFYRSSLLPMTSMSLDILENKPLNPEWQITPYPNKASSYLAFKNVRIELSGGDLLTGIT